MGTMKRVQGLDPQVDQLQGNVLDAVNPLLAQPRAGAVLLKNVALVAGTNTIPHGLGRKLQGWDIVRQRGAPGVFASYNTATAQSIPNSTFTTINYDTKTTDTDNAVTTGAGWQFKCPNGKGGTYLVTAGVQLVVGTTTATDIVFSLCRNGSEVFRLPRYSCTTSSGNVLGLNGSALIQLSAADTVQMKLYQNNGGVARTLENANISNWIQIARLDGISAPPIYDTQDSNPTPDRNLVLVSAFPVTIDLEVF